MEIPVQKARRGSARRSLSKALQGASNRLLGMNQIADPELATIESVPIPRYLEGEKEKLLRAIGEGKTVPTAELLQNLVLSPGGFLNREFRSRVWPVLLGVQGKKVEAKEVAPTSNIESDLSTMKNDVARSFSQWQTNDFDLSGDLEKYRDSLYKLMVRHFHDDANLHYYQGFNDVAAVHLLTCGEEMAVLTLARQSKFMLKDYHAQTMEPTVRVTNVLYAILEKVDRRVSQKLKKAQVKPLFSLSWLLTGFAHDLTNFDSVCRLYDAFLAFHPLFPIYTAAALVVTPRFRSELLRLGNDAAEIHHYLQSLPATTEKMREKFSLDRLLQAALGIMKTFPPKTVLIKVRDLEKDSMLFGPYPYPWE